MHRVVAIPVPATSTDACIHVTSDESRKEHMNKPRASPPINITPPLTHCFLQRNDPGRRTPAYAIDRDLPRLSVIHEVGCRLPPHSFPSVRSVVGPAGERSPCPHPRRMPPPPLPLPPVKPPLPKPPPSPPASDSSRCWVEKPVCDYKYHAACKVEF